MLKPIATTITDWPTFIEACQEHLGYSPTRGLDAIGLSPKDPKAYLACLNLENDALKSLKDQKAYKHIFYSFITVADSLLLIDISSYTDLSILSKATKKHDQFLVIVSGTLFQWQHAIIDTCTFTSSKETRSFSNRCLQWLEAGGCKDAWAEYKKFTLADGTICLQKSN